MKRIVLMALLAGLVGCSTTPIQKQLARPTRQVLDADITTERSGTLPLIVKRDSGFVGSGCPYKLFLDGKPVAILEPDEKVTLWLNPGPHVLSMQAQGILCPATIIETEVKMVAGDNPVYRIGVSGSTMQPFLTRTAF